VLLQLLFDLVPALDASSQFGVLFGWLLVVS
jgi:hypothetical protein